MWVKKRHKFFHFFFRPLVHLIFRVKCGFRSKKYKLKKGAHLILFNHPSNYDPIFVGSSLSKPTYFIANEDLFNIPYVSRILNYLVAPIPKQKSMKDTSTIRTALKVIKEGGNIGVSPEGNRTYSGKLNHIDYAIVKFIKLLKVPVILFTISGGFGINPRFSKTLRKGKVFGKVAKVIEQDDVLKLTQDELYEIITTTLDVDDTALGFKYTGKALAESLESVFYICPICHEFHTIRSSDNHIHCDNCKMSAEYTSQLLLKTNDERFKYKKIREYYEFQNNFILNYNIKSLTYDKDTVTLFTANRGKERIALIEGKLVFNHDTLEIINASGAKSIGLTEIISLSIVYHNTLIVNLENEKFHIVGDEKFNALKYLHLFTLIKNNEQGAKNAFLGI